MNMDHIYLVKTKAEQLYIGQLIINYEDGTAVKEILKEAYQLQIIPVSQSNFSVMMLPVFAPISKECVDIDISNNILAKCPPNEDLKNQYISARTNLVTQTDLSTQNKIIGAGI